MFVSMNAAPTTAALPNAPDPHPDQAPGSAPAPTRTSRLLSLIHTLIAYGTAFAQALQQRATVPASVAQQFGTLNIALILSRIVRGLQLATALEARLVAHPLREMAPSAALRAPTYREPRIAPPVEPRARRPVLPPLPDMPTAEQIAEAVRRRPAGAVIADICRDLGIVPSHPLWRKVMMAVTEFGGNYARLFSDVVKRVCTWLDDPGASADDRSPASWPQAAAACGTGPP
jgi:hypothetical protein